MKRAAAPVRAALAVVLVVVVVSVTAVAAGAATGDAKRRQAEIERQIKSLRGEVAEASAEEAELLDRIDASRQRRAALDRSVVELEGRIREALGELNRAEAALRVVTRELEEAEAKLKATEAELVSAREELRQRAVSAYVGRPEGEVAQLALGVRNVRELGAVRVYYGAVVREQQETVDRFRALREEIAELRSDLRARRTDAADRRDDVAAKTAGLEAARREQDRLRQQVAAEEVAQQGLLREVESRIAHFEGQIAALRKESSAITELLKRVQSGQGTTLSGRGVIGSPIPGARLTSRFGSRLHPIFGTPRMHTGVDYGAGSGTPIRAAADGVVVFAGSRGGYGQATVIDHGGSLATLYAHQSAILVRDGQRVRRGEVIGRVGSTGYSTGPHLHFEVRRDGVPVDPLRYL